MINYAWVMLQCLPLLSASQDGNSYFYWCDHIHSLCIQATHLFPSPPHIHSNTSNDKTNDAAKDASNAETDADPKDATIADTKDATIHVCENKQEIVIVATIG